MKLKFALLTWWTAILLNTIFSTIYLSYDSMYLELGGWLGLLLASFIVTSLFSTPGFAGIFLWLWVADNFYVTSVKKLIFFSAACLFTTLLCYGLLFYIINVSPEAKDFFYLIMLGVVSVLASVILQRNFFYRIVTPVYE